MRTTCDVIRNGGFRVIVFQYRFIIVRKFVQIVASVRSYFRLSIFDPDLCLCVFVIFCEKLSPTK